MPAIADQTAPRAALICLPVAGDPASPVLAGRSICARQLDLALHLGCGLVVLHGPGHPGEAVALRHRAEAAGARVVLIGSAHALSGAIPAQGSLLVLQPGLLPESPAAIAALREAAAILVVSAGPGAQAGFERIDLDRAWAGALVLPGTMLGRLAALPEDSDPAPALLRVALQQRLPEARLADGLLDGGDWCLIRTATMASAQVSGWLQRAAGAPDTGQLTRRLARQVLVGRLGAGAENARQFPALLALAAVLGGGALVAGWWQLAPLAFGLVAVAALVVELLVGLARIRAAPFGNPGRWPQLRVATDLLLLAAGALVIGSPIALALFVAFVLVAGLRLLDRQALPGWRGLLRDRGALSLLLVLLCAILAPVAALMLVAAGLLLANLATHAAKGG